MLYFNLNQEMLVKSCDHSNWLRILTIYLSIFWNGNQVTIGWSFSDTFLISTEKKVQDCLGVAMSSDIVTGDRSQEGGTQSRSWTRARVLCLQCLRWCPGSTINTELVRSWLSLVRTCTKLRVFEHHHDTKHRRQEIVRKHHRRQEIAGHH